MIINTREHEISRAKAYVDLVKDRQTFSWILTAVTVTLYSGFLVLIAFAKPFMAQIFVGNITISVVSGMLVLIGVVAICGLYVRRANNVYDVRLGKLLREVDQ